MLSFPGMRSSQTVSTPGNWRSDRGFSLVEILVATAVLAILLVIVFNITSQTGKLWRSTNSKITSFQNARAAFDAITRNLGQATLNHYYDYYDSGWNTRGTNAANFVPARYARRSELEFVCGPSDKVFSSPGDKIGHTVLFQAPLGRVNGADFQIESSALMNAVGYYVEYADASKYDQIPKFLRSQSANDRKGFRLIEWIQPSEKLRIYDKALMAGGPRSWIAASVAGDPQFRVMADNVVALIIQPRREQNDTSLAPNYSYDSNPATDSDPSKYDPLRSHLLPPLIQVTLVAIDEDSANRLREINGTSTPSLVSPTWFQDAASYDSDLKKLEEALNGGNGGPRLNYKIFTTTVSTREGKS